MKISDIKLLYDYNYWANQLMLSKAAELSSQQLQEANSFPWGSLQGTLIHILDTEYGWRMLCQHNQISFDLNETEDFSTLESIIEYWKNDEAEMRAYLDNLTDDDMESIVRYEVKEGVRERVLWHCLWHLANHGTQHRSECAQMLTEFGHSPGDIDFTLYLNTRANK